MNEVIKPIAEWCAAIIEMLGIAIVTVLALHTSILAIARLLKQDKNVLSFDKVRQRLGRGILLGLEFLVAADIIYTVAVELSFQTVGVLAIIVLIRTFLSFTLEVELTGNWPWQNEE